MKTLKTEVTGTIQIWAVPTHSFEMSRYNNEPFHYVLTTTKVYRTGSFKVCEFEVTGVVPEGINMIEAACSTIDDEIKDTRAEAWKKIEELEEEKTKLLMLEHKPDLEVIVNDQ